MGSPSAESAELGGRRDDQLLPPAAQGTLRWVLPPAGLLRGFSSGTSSSRKSAELQPQKRKL